MMLKLMFDLVCFFSSVTIFFYFHLGESILLLALIYYLLRQVLYCLPQLWSAHKWILWTISFRSEPYLFSFVCADVSNFVSKHTKFNEYGYFMGAIYPHNVLYLGCNTNVCGYCRDTTFVVVTRQVGMIDPVCLFT